MSKVGKRNPNSPLGLKPAMRSNSADGPVKVTDNSSNWSEVRGIAVPPAPEARDFQSSLGLRPVLTNGGERSPDPLPAPAKVPAVKIQTSPGIFLSPEPEERPASPQVVPSGSGVFVELDWHGARLTIPCVRAVFQPEETSRGGQAWLLLEMKIDPRTGRPSWLPPPSREEEDGRISVPEFDCVVDNRRLHCQMLNVELFDKFKETYFLILRVIKEHTS